MIKPIKFQAKIEKISELTKDLKIFRLSVPEEFDFEPGQFIVIILGNERRQYSIARKEGHSIELCIDKVEGGRVSPQLHTMNEGDELACQGPLGIFTLKKDASEKDATFIATGTGVTPFVSMIESLLMQSKRKVQLLVGYKYTEEILYDDYFKKLVEEYKNFSYHVVISRDETYKGEQGRVQQLLEKYVSKENKGDFYICGLFNMIKDVGLLLTKEWKATKEQIIFERYD